MDATYFFLYMEWIFNTCMQIGNYVKYNVQSMLLNLILRVKNKLFFFVNSLINRKINISARYVNIFVGACTTHHPNQGGWCGQLCEVLSAASSITILQSARRCLQVFFRLNLYLPLRDSWIFMKSGVIVKLIIIYILETCLALHSHSFINSLVNVILHFLLYWDQEVSKWEVCSLMHIINNINFWKMVLWFQ